MESTSLLDGEKRYEIYRDTAKAISAELRKAARKARSPQPVLRGGGGFRARKSDRYFHRLLVFIFAIIFVTPVCGALIYYGTIAADQYVTEARFAVRSGSDTSIAGLSALASFIDTGQARDGLIIADYVKSTALIETLSQKFDLREMFSKTGNDLLARFDAAGSAEDFVEYWEDQVNVSVDRNSGLVTLKLRAFTPQDSFVLTESIISEAERMVNQLTRKSEIDALVRTERQLKLKREKLQKMVSQLRDARNAAGLLDVDMTAKAYTDLLTDLRLELSKQELLIKTTAANAPQMQPLLSRAAVLRQQIMEYERAIAGEVDPSHAGATNLAEVATEIQQKDIELSIAKEEYAQAMAAYEGARLSIERQRSYLLTYVKPRLAEEATYPRRFLMCLAVFSAAAFLAAMMIGIAFMVRDHMAK
jgi:capsular polysaccharide transport system permease protein